MQTHHDQLKATCQAAGIDWNNLLNVVKNLPWQQVLALIELIAQNAPKA